ncbi:MAG: M50 family metallopeptidase [Peptoniphilaceae bacterium]|nr:M50 family metallopeptidase [Peptoniphilaceae bacterium]MDD7382989.1 M50 family metallopeptidase [Peptoniphilaceae bacterium]MDY3737740.1 M50 family metallopeptidase [Peptoniphilaceae bacterium]
MVKIIIAFIMFLSLVLFHEFGHFIVAKISGIKVNEFAVGMGPKIFSKQKGETLYSLNLFPIGGYCAMEGEDDESDDPSSYTNAKSYKKFFTILAGPAMNFIIAIIVFAIVAFNMGVSTNEVGGFSENSSALKSGIEIGDEIISVNNNKIKEFADISKYLNDFYSTNSRNKQVEITVLKNGKIKKEKQYEVNADFSTGSPLLGIYASQKKEGIIRSIKEGIKETWKMSILLVKTIFSLITGKLKLSSLSGPIGVIKVLGEQANEGFFNLLYFLGYISVNLGFFNLLPIPALDGSKILESLFEMISGKKVNKKISIAINTAGFIFLLGLILIVSIKDIVTLF